MPKRRPAWLLTCLLLLAPPCAPRLCGQAAPLAALLPEDFGVAIELRHLRTHWRELQDAPAVKALAQSSLGRALVESREWRELAASLEGLARQLAVDLPTLRDEVLGDEVVLAYRPGPARQPAAEDGLLLLRARNPALLKQLVDRVNEKQRESGELRELTEHNHGQATYQQRRLANRSHYLLLDGELLAVAANAATLHAVIDRRKQPTSGWAERFRRAGSEQALLTLCVNPRGVTVDAELGKRLPRSGGLWQALDAIFVTVHVRQTMEWTLTLQARANAMPAWFRPAFERDQAASELWRYFPDQAVVAFAGRTDVKQAARTMAELAPALEPLRLRDAWQSTVGAITGLDPVDDLLPNLGPDWGFFVLPVKDAADFPPMLAALAVQPGDKGVDQTLVRGVHALAALALLEHNKARASPLKLTKLAQASGEGYCLSGDALPRGCRPAFALKHGFFLVASSPDLIEQFERRRDLPPGEIPLMRISTSALAQQLQMRREPIAQSVSRQTGVPAAEIRQTIAHTLEVLSTLDRIDLTQRAIADQASWTLRLVPAR